jgi:hypothetical protein
MVSDIITRLTWALSFLFISIFLVCSSVSVAVKVQLMGLISSYTIYQASPEIANGVGAYIKQQCLDKPFRTTILVFLTGSLYRYIQQKLRYTRLNEIKHKYGFTNDRASFKGMTIEQAQDIEKNMSEWEFPRLYMFAWVSDFLRASLNVPVNIVHSLTTNYRLRPIQEFHELSFDLDIWSTPIP